ncbi:hypothetical protein M5362_26580 [Streptomyces sp. Je 1-79]|uniref:hypothetical protein n=1 Tax=Streptomyces sp. Je 1-79 TaxID=2943847 RepID=UPI0021A811D1|nr:hypothetical protein [Streptomyces sp. Je 1-79]MCT4356698.1 hypothetical protein [Streptomyces sp. Je 1-79]
MSTDAHRPTSRISEALLPPPTPAPDAAPQGAPHPAPPGRPPAPRPDTPAPNPTSAASPSGRPPAPRPDTPAPNTTSAAGPHGVPPQPTEPPASAGRPSAPVPAPGAATGPTAPPPRPATPPRTIPTHPASPGTSARSGTPGAHPVAPRTPTHPAPPTTPARPAASAPAADVPAVERTTRLRPIRDTPSRPGPPRPATPPPAPTHPAPVRPTTPAPPRPAQTYGTYGAYRPYTAPPETLAETTTRLRPIRERRVGRVVAAGACLVLGVGLVGGAVAGAVLATTDAGAPDEPEGYAEARTVWHSVPVDTLFPRTLAGPGEGPGAADRTWTRVVVAADTPCTPAVLPKSVLTTLQPVGCDRVLRATYTDATASSVITVGLVFTQADPTAARSLGVQSAARLGADVPPALSAPGTAAARFGAAQRASWWTRALTDLPVVVTAVSGFADGRPAGDPVPADRAMADGQTSATAQAGLGHEAKGVADRIERALRTTVTTAARGDE